MREIKFRAWNKKQGRWEKELCLYLDDSEIGDVSECFHNQENKDDYIIEQWTGLKDKNGQDIYEGDLVNFEWFSGPSSDPFREKELNKEVYFEDAMFLFGRGIMFAINDSNFIEESLEVVGNIHETK